MNALMSGESAGELEALIGSTRRAAIMNLKQNDPILFEPGQKVVESEFEDALAGNWRPFQIQTVRWKGCLFLASDERDHETICVTQGAVDSPRNVAARCLLEDYCFLVTTLTSPPSFNQ